ncbi:MAG: hypothetical protein ACREGF_00015 [Candidatus Saccharimonadales bacterium]
MPTYFTEAKPQFSPEDLAVQRRLVIDNAATYLLNVIVAGFGSDLQLRAAAPQAPVETPTVPQSLEVNNYQAQIERPATISATPAIPQSAEVAAHETSLHAEPAYAPFAPNPQPTGQEMLIAAARQQLMEAHRDGTV